MEFGDSVVEYRGSMVGGRAEFFVSHDFLSPTEIFFVSHGGFVILTEFTECTEVFYLPIFVSHRLHR